MSEGTRQPTRVLPAPSPQEISATTGIPPAEVVLCLDDLEARGWISRHDGIIELFDEARPS